MQLFIQVQSDFEQEHSCSVTKLVDKWSQLSVDILTYALQLTKKDANYKDVQQFLLKNPNATSNSGKCAYIPHYIYINLQV